MDEFVKIGQKLTDGCHGLLRFVIKYGSESKNSDTDYLAVYKNLYRTQSITAGCLDFWAISENSLEKYIQVVDPFVTEPILTGKIVYGDNDEVYSIIERVSSIEITPEAIRHLIARSFKSFDVACNVVPSDSNSDQVSNREYWSGLSYSISYWCFAKAYKKNDKGAIKLSKAIEQAPTDVQKIWEKTVREKQYGTNISAHLIDSWANCLLREAK